MNYYTSKITFALHFLEFLLKKSVKIQQKRNKDKTPYVCSKKLAPVKKILHRIVVMVETFRRSGTTRVRK